MISRRFRVEEVDSYSNSVYKNSVVYGSKTYQLNGIAEIAVIKEAQTLAAYTDEFYAGAGALFVNEYGRGKVSMEPCDFYVLKNI